MRHEKTLFAKVLYAFFIGVSAAWMLVVINATSTWDAPKAWGLAFLGAAIIAFIGLRLVTILDTKWFIRSCNAKAKRQPVMGIDPLESYQVGHRQPYFDARVSR